MCNYPLDADSLIASINNLFVPSAMVYSVILQL